jgi:hypothetical protein
MDIVDERSFLQWKEDVNDAYLGKGKALFQVKIINLFQSERLKKSLKFSSNLNAF